MASWRKNRVLDVICVATLLLFAIGIAYPRWRAWVDWRDEGLLAYGAVRVMNGQIPHRDFVSLQPPLSYYTSAAVFKLLGTSLLSLRIFGLSIFLLLPFLIYGVGRNFMGPIVCLASAIPSCVLGMPYMRFVPFAVWQGITASFASVLLLLLAIRLKREWLAFAGGALVAISAFLRHDQAVYTGIATVVLGVALHFARLQSLSQRSVQRALYLWLAGIATVFIPLVIVWWTAGALPEMYRQLFVFPFATYRKTSGLPFPRLVGQQTWVDAATSLLFYIPLFIEAIAGIYLAQSIIRRRFELPQAILLFLLAWSALFYLQVAVRSDLTHLLMTLPPVFLLAAFGWSIIIGKLTGRLRLNLATSSPLALIVASFLWILRPVELPDMSEQTELLSLPRGGVRVARAGVIADFFHNLEAAVPPQRPILALPYQPMFYFLSERRNPTRWNYLWPGDQTNRDYQELIEEAERDPPAIVLLSEQSALEQFAPLIVEYIKARYLYTDRLGDIAIYVRRGSD